MSRVNEKIRDLRVALGVSQEYVSKFVGISRSAVAQIERGGRKVSADELGRFCELFGVSADYIVGKEADPVGQTVFARSFSELSVADQREVMNLISFKRAMASQLGE